MESSWMELKMITLCKDCKWVKLSWLERFGFFGKESFAKCENPTLRKLASINIVTGRIKKERLVFADSERQHFGHCGPEAKLFIQKD